MKVYVVTMPESIRGIYETWPACQTAVAGVPGARYQAVASREIAESMLEGSGVRLEPGRYAFTDGNADGGVGVVLIDQPSNRSPQIEEISTSVEEIFTDARLPGLESPAAIAKASVELRNEFAELAALYLTLSRAAPDSALTIVHDYKGVADYLENRWRARGDITPVIVNACRELIERRRLTVVFRYQPAHQSAWAGRDDFAHWNGKADQLAREGAPRH